MWVSLGAKVVAATADGGEFDLPLDEFFVGYRKTKLPEDAVILKVVVPLRKGEVVRAYKQVRLLGGVARRGADLEVSFCAPGEEER